MTLLNLTQIVNFGTAVLLIIFLLVAATYIQPYIAKQITKHKEKEKPEKGELNGKVKTLIYLMFAFNIVIWTVIVSTW